MTCQKDNGTRTYSRQSKSWKCFLIPGNMSEEKVMVSFSKEKKIELQFSNLIAITNPSFYLLSLGPKACDCWRDKMLQMLFFFFLPFKRRCSLNFYFCRIVHVDTSFVAYEMHYLIYKLLERTPNIKINSSKLYFYKIM